MPPKVKVSKQDIINAALKKVRASGDYNINARSIAADLNCSTQPIFSNFSCMEELQEEVIKAGYEVYLNFLKSEAESSNYPKYKAFGMAYIRFAKEEKPLFKLLFMRDMGGNAITPTADFDESVEMIMKNNGVTEQTARLMHMEMWAFVHGIGTMLATSFLDFEWEFISNMLSDIYNGTRAIHLSKEQKNECN